MTERGARVILEDGQALISIAARPGSAWIVEAGPFSIVSTGGRLDVSFTPAEEAIRVRVLDGSATVRGPALLEGISLRAREELVAREGGRPIVARADVHVGADHGAD